MTDPSPFPNPTIIEMMADRADLHARIDALLKVFHFNSPGLQLKPALRESWSELRLSISACFSESVGTCDMGDARLALGQLEDDILEVLRPFAKKYFRATLALSFEYVNCDPQSTLSLHF
jgi:hypothetical protein